MKTRIVLLRGINVGGRNKLPMKELVALLESLDCETVRTYIQSGNVVLRCTDKISTDLSIQIGLKVKNLYGFELRVLMLHLEDFVAAILNNPFPEGESDPKTLHLGFLESAAVKPDLDKLESLKAKNERFRLIGKVFYLHAPGGIGNSRLAASSERSLGVAMTSRNWRTVCRIRDLAGE
jgi:uncharacterized protein (DUF1697 family)